MQSSSENNAVLTTAKTRGKKKRVAAYQSPLLPSPSSSSSGTRRQSISDDWDPVIGSNFRLNNKTPKLIPMPEIHHHGLAAALPVPLNSVLKKWNNAPQLFQYRPTELQVIYHRRTGETEITTPDTNKFLDHEISNTQNSTNIEFSPTNTPPLSALSLEMAIDVDSSKCEKQIIVSTKSISCSTDPIKRLNFECQTDIETLSSFCQTEEFQLDHPKAISDAIHSKEANKFSLVETETQTTRYTFSSNSTQTTETQDFQKKSSLNQCRSSQTEVLPAQILAKLSSQNTTNSTAQTEAIQLQSKSVETMQTTFVVAETQVSIKPSCSDHNSQTDMDIDNPIPCMSCQFKTLQVEELEEKVEELNKHVKITEKNLKVAKEELENIYIPKTSVRHASTNTKKMEAFDPISQKCLQDEVAKCRSLEQENKELHATVKKLQTQLHSFQSGLIRLRTAIEKPIADDYIVSEEAIKEVINKADNLVNSYSNSQNRAAKITDHLSVLNSCVTIANGLLEDDKKPE